MRGYMALRHLRLGHGFSPKIYKQLAGAVKFGGGDTMLEFDEYYLPVASEDVQKQRDEAERLALYWGTRAAELEQLLAANVQRQMPRVEQPKKTPHKPKGPRRVRCPGCRALYRPDEKHDAAACRDLMARIERRRLARAAEIVAECQQRRTGSGYPGGGVPR
jgi:hypothetical protein